MANVKPNRLGILTLVLGVLLIATVGYISFDKYQNVRDTQMRMAYQQGYDLGITASVVSVFQQTNNCQITTLTVGNMTKQIIDVACLRAAAQQTTQQQ
jgi:predicted negative regulator of RcsB-dependent stress response